ncbi:FAD dependent oxidoreductase superfamily [Colletotrichum melonis]|uniref:FAD dependent oxidoreductase superfamily n=1 Tax=Colletotrichum melonis TaxID=1209925 RepID=A0AAI9TWA5_9PEZI|nr:FAD dependent oxidoreductase superfamily [Colletotrichum melonis]
MSSTVILGSGIIGLSIAYYLADHQPGSAIHLVDPSPELFASASGYAGGFLARDWFSPDSASLGALSFDEHRTLAEEHGGREKWGWSTSTTFSHAAAPVKKGKKDAGWLQDGGSRAEVVKPDPLRLCHFLLEECKSAGVHVHHPATALSIHTDLRDELSSVRIGETTSSTETDVPCTRLVIAAGAWSPRVFSQLFPGTSLQVPISSLAGYSLVVKPKPSPPESSSGNVKATTACHAIFSTDGAGFSPELFSRVGGNVYVAGLNSPSTPLPSLPGQVPISAEAIAKLKSTAARIITNSNDSGTDLQVVREGLCFRPVTDSGAPILTRIPDDQLGSVATRTGAEGGVFLAAGHGPWGISLSLGTGKVMAELMQGRKLSADISRLGLT